MDINSPNGDQDDNETSLMHVTIHAIKWDPVFG